MLPALAHVPPAHVKASFELVVEEITDVIEREQFEESVVEKMDQLAIYFKSTYIDIWLLLRNLEKDSKMQKFKYVQETAGLLSSKRPRYEKIKEQMQNIRSTYEFENAAPYLEQ